MSEYVKIADRNENATKTGLCTACGCDYRRIAVYRGSPQFSTYITHDCLDRIRRAMPIASREGWDQPRFMARPKLESGTETVRVQIVAPATFVDRIDEWRAKMRPIPSRAEAIRILVDQALDAGGTRQNQSQA